MNAVEIIRKKRDGEELTRNDLARFIASYVDGSLPEYQMAAFLMAVYYSGMTPSETSVFTEVMLRSGEVIDLSFIPGLKVDKHSTGGVGDKVSLILAPMVAACGVPVPMISGRGLGHTGGTLDKLESIPGFRTDLSVDEYRKVIGELGAVLTGQTKEIAPADRKMYALRDVTATVESIPLIAGSIMSKKLAEGIDALVLDIKTGNGAFMKTRDDSLALATALVTLGNRLGKTTVGFITDMSQPLGFAIGNWLEVVESVECLRGKHVPDLMEVTYVLGGTMVWLGKKASSIEEGMKQCREAIWTGKAYELFLQLVARQGGDTAFLENTASYPASNHEVDVLSHQSGFVTGVDTFSLGVVATELGAGRLKVDDTINPKAGIQIKKKIGDQIEIEEPIAVIHADNSNIVASAADRVRSAFAIGNERPGLPSLIQALVDQKGVHDWTTPVLY